MDRIFCDKTRIKTDEDYYLLKNHINALIDKATTKGYLSEQGADNEYTREIARLGKIGALYETEILHLPKRSVNPLVVEIEKEIRNRGLTHNRAAELIGVNAPTFLKVIRGQRQISMRMAKKLFNEFNINPELIIRYS
jgi:antitoxin component HigA of HigAB toxin-antitoxin module